MKPTNPSVQMAYEDQISFELQDSHATWKPMNTWNFVIYVSRHGKCLKFAQK